MAVATWQLSAVGYQIAKSRAVFHTYAPATVKANGKGNGNGNSNGNYTKDVLK